MVLVEADSNGYDVGRISLSGDLVRVQMKKRNVKENAILPNVIRKANERDLERLQESREAEKPTMILARAIARTLKLDMKIGDVEYQGDKRKATFYYTADGRVDFRELIREFAKEFKVKVEMRQIGARQESARVGGLGPCGRELCCSTWLTDFKSVSTTAARYQNLAINQSKLSGQCGRLKCCLNYELDTYMDALEQFPTKADKIHTEEGSAVLMKTDIFKGLMYYCYEKDHGRGKFYPLEIEQVKDVLTMNRAGQKPLDLLSLQTIEEEEEEVGFDGDLTGVVELPNDRKKKKKKKKKPELRKDERRDRPKADFAPKSTDSVEQKDTKSEAPRNNNKGDNRPPRRDDRKDKPRRDDRQNVNEAKNPDAREPRQNNENRRPDNRPPREQRDNQNNTNELKNQPPREPRPNNENRRPDNRPPREQRDNQNNTNEVKNQPPREPRPNNESRRPDNRPPREPRDNQNNTNEVKNQPPREPRPNNENRRPDNRPPREPRDNQNNDNRPPRPPQPPRTENTPIDNNDGANTPVQNPQEKKDFKNKNFKNNKWKNKNKSGGDRKPDNNDKKE
jgi:cell fate regulator YaaT (PSP1 superfamily)